MASYRITCVDISTTDSPQGHGHITHAHTASDTWGVSLVRSMIAQGDRFYTVSPSTGIRANVERYNCACGVLTIRSDPDHVTDNNLDNMEC